MGSYSFREWTMPFTPKQAGALELKVRAFNRIGQSQPMQALWNPAGYMRNVVRDHTRERRMKRNAAMKNNCSIRSLSRPARLLLAGLFGLLATSVQALDIELPAETAQYTPSDLPGYTLVLRNCMICHSAQYAQSQPPASPRAYWDATVKKMKKPFGATYPDEDTAAMVDYLVKTYGAEHAASTTAATTGAPETQK